VSLENNYVFGPKSLVYRREIKGSETAFSGMIILSEKINFRRKQFTSFTIIDVKMLSVAACQENWKISF